MKRFLSVVLIIGLITLGIFSNVAVAKHTNQKVRVDWIISRIRTYYDSTASEQFITYLSQHIDEGLILVCLDLNNDANFTITMWGLPNVGVKWSESNADSYYLGYFHPNDSTGYIYRCDGYFNSFYNGGNYTFRSRVGFDETLYPGSSRLVKFPDFSSPNKKLYMGSAQSFWSMDYLCLTNCDIYASYVSASVLYDRSLYGALVALYQNVVFYKNDRLYFTFSDQDVFFDVFVGSADAELKLTVEGSFMGESGEIETGTGSFLYHESDFVRFPDIITYEGVTNISPNGLRAIDITALSNYSKLVGSRVQPDGYYEMGYFADNEIIISNIITTPVDPYDPLSDALSQLEQRVSALENAPVPDNTLQHYTRFPDSRVNGASYPDVGYYYDYVVDSYGYVRLYDSEEQSYISLDVYPRSCLVVRSNDYGLSLVTGKLWDSDDISTLWSQVDVVVVLPNDSYDAVLAESTFDPIYISTFTDSGITYRGSWFLTQWADADTEIGNHTQYLGEGFFTEHYLICVNNYILSDGFTTLADGLTALGELNKDGFQAVVSSVGSAYSAIQITNSHWVNFLRDFGAFSNGVTAKLENILTKFDLAIDKLNQIEYNTSKEEVGVWYQSLWDFFSQFVPSNNDFIESITALDTGIDNLTPIPYVTPPLLENNNE